MADPNDWLNQAIEDDVMYDDEPDNYSFEDSERFEEESSCSHNSFSDGICENYAGWSVENDSSLIPPFPHTFDKYSPVYRERISSVVTTQHPEKTGVKSLCMLASQECARSLSFGQMEETYREVRERSKEEFPHSIPEDFYLVIQKCCFPKSARDIRLYSCLSNGSSDIYNNGETIYQIDGVKNVLQIGFLVTGDVCTTSMSNENNMARQFSETRNIFKVTLRVDRCRIIECTCSCKSSSLWCEHAVALSLFRLHKPDVVQYRITIWESVTELTNQKLQKFAQYLINELPRDYLPVAQKLLDQLKDPNSEINNSLGAPDPTDGGHEEVPLWALEPGHLSERIRSKLIRYCTPSPEVYAPGQDHSSPPSPITREWQSIHKSFRTREPDWIWNLLSIIRELLTRRDGNALRLLQSLTNECFNNSQVLIWWYVTNLSHGGAWKQCPSARSVDSNQYTSQMNGANICEELVKLWKLVSLNPALTTETRNELFSSMQMYHQEACQRIWLIVKGKTNVDVNSTLNTALLNNVIDAQGQPLTLNNARFTLNHFPGFYKALQAHLTCTSCDSVLPRGTIARPYPALTRELVQSSLVPGSMIMLVTPQQKKKQKNKRKSKRNNRRPDPVVPQYAMVMNPLQGSSAESGQESDQESAERPVRPSFPRDDVSSVLAASYVPLDPFEQRVTQCEILETHGYKKQAFQLAKEIMKSLLKQLIQEKENVVACDMPSTSKSSAPQTSQWSVPCADYEKHLFRMETVLFMAKILAPSHRYDHLLFSTIVQLLEASSQPSRVSYFAIKRFYLESELIQILQHSTLTSTQLDLLRESAEKISNVVAYGELPSYYLALFIFQKLPYTSNMVIFDASGNPKGTVQTKVKRLPEDDELTLKCALDVLGARLVLPDEDYPMIAECIRRLKRELAVDLLDRFKNSCEKLGLILDKLLDPSIHRMYRYHLSNAAYFLERDNTLIKHTIRGQRPVYPYKPLPSPEVSRITIAEEIENASGDMAKMSVGQPTCSTAGTSAATINDSDRVTVTQSTHTKPYPKRKAYQNHSVSDSQAKHYEDLAKAILQRAGGSQISHMFAPMGQEALGPHRNLHICSLLVVIYSLGLKNKQTANWEIRTYSKEVSVIGNQVHELGSHAMEILRETWHGHLTPSETAAIADKESQTPNEEVVREAARLGQSVLPFCSKLTQSEVRKAIEQCKEQGNSMLETACQMIDKAATESFLEPHILFTVAHYWGQLHEQTNPTNQTPAYPNNPMHPVQQPMYHQPAQMYNLPYQQFHPQSMHYPPPNFAAPPPNHGHYPVMPPGTYRPPTQSPYLVPNSMPAASPPVVPNRLHQSHSAPQLNEAPAPIDAASKLVRAFNSGLKAMENLRNIMNEESNRNKLAQDGIYSVDIEFVKNAARMLGPTYYVSFFESAIRNIPFYKILLMLANESIVYNGLYSETAAYRTYERASHTVPRQSSNQSGPLIGQVRQNFLVAGYTVITADLYDRCVEQACVLTATKMNYNKFSPDEKSQINIVIAEVYNIFNEFRNLRVNIHNFHNQYTHFVRKQKGYKCLQLELKKSPYPQNYQHMPHC